MALHWSIEHAKDWQQLAEDDEQRKITEAVVWAALVYDLSGVTEKNIDEWRLRQEFARHVDDFYPITRPRTQDHSATCSSAPSSSDGFLTAAATAYQASAMELSAAWQDRQIPMIWAAIASELDIAAWKIEKIVKQRLDPKHSPIRRKE